MTPQRLAQALPCKEALGFDELQTLADHLCRCVRPGDTVVIMGAGDVDKIYSYLPLIGTSGSCE
mgnify:CR=1 FL=1